MYNKLQIIADEALAGLELLSGYNVKTFKAADLVASDLATADVLLVRSVTKVNANLLSLAKQLKFVGTATSGTDHVDTALLKTKSISFAAAPGSNAHAVVDYVLASLLDRYAFDELQQMTIGVLGYGNVGRRLVFALQQLGLSYRVCDPLCDQAVPNASTFEALLGCDILSLHVPLTSCGEHQTLELFNSMAFKQMPNLQCLINTSRGEVISPAALEAYLLERAGNPPYLIFDVWPGEPLLNIEILRACCIATPHIAGHSLAGKLRAVNVIVDELAKLLEFKLDADAVKRFEARLQAVVEPAPWLKMDVNKKQELEELRQGLSNKINLTTLTEQLKKALLPPLFVNSTLENNIMPMSQAAVDKHKQAFIACRQAYTPRAEFFSDLI